MASARAGVALLHGEVRRRRDRRRPCRLDGGLRLARAGKSVLLVDKARFPRDKPCGGGLTCGPCASCRLDRARRRGRARRAFELPPPLRAQLPTRVAREPLFLMTQRRRLDAFLAEQAVAAGPSSATARASTSLRDRVAGRRRAGRGRRRSSARTARTGSRRGSLGLGGAIVRGVALEGNVRCEELAATASRGRSCSSSARSRAATAGSSRRATTRTSASAAGAAKARSLRDHLARLCRHVRHRARRAHRRSRPSAADAAAGHRARARTARSLVGDAAGLVDPLSGDGMYEAFVSARLAAEHARLAQGRDEPRAVRGGGRRELDPPRGGVVGGEARARPLPARVSSRSCGCRCVFGVVEQPRARRGRASERGPRAWPAGRCRLIEALARLALRPPQPRRLKTPRSPADAGSRDGAQSPFSRRAVELGASDIHLKLGQPPVLRRDGELEPLEGRADPDGDGSRDRARRSSATARPSRRDAFEADRRPRHRLLGPTSAALPRQRLPPARRTSRSPSA